MPVTRIAIRDGKTSQYKQALLDEIYEAMRETVAIKEGDRFMAITEHTESEFAHGPFLGISRPPPRTGRSATARPSSTRPPDRSPPVGDRRPRPPQAAITT
jgi:hypothetical protein